MNLNDLLPQIVNLTDAERNAGASLRTPEAIRSASYRLVKACDEDRYPLLSLLVMSGQLQKYYLKAWDYIQVCPSLTGTTATFVWRMSR